MLTMKMPRKTILEILARNMREAEGKLNDPTTAKYYAGKRDGIKQAIEFLERK